MLTLGEKTQLTCVQRCHKIAFRSTVFKMRFALTIVLAATGFAADLPPWEDLTYRKEVNQLMTDGRLAEAAASARAILAKAEKDHGPDSIQTALALDVLTELYFYSDYVRDPEAEQIAARA